MNSIGKILAGFEWDYDGPVSIVYGRGYQGKGISRTLFLSPKLEDIPEQLFAVKVSQSQDPAKAGKIVFRYFSFRFNPNEKYQNLAPTGVTMETPLAEIKNLVVSKFMNLSDNVDISISVSLHGKWTSVTCADRTIAVYDETKDEFKDPDPNKNGRAPYYINPDAQIHVKLKGAESQGNEYLQSQLSTTATADETFVAMANSEIWEGGKPVSKPSGSASTDGNPGPVW